MIVSQSVEVQADSCQNWYNEATDERKPALNLLRNSQGERPV